MAAGGGFRAGLRLELVGTQSTERKHEARNAGVAVGLVHELDKDGV